MNSRSKQLGFLLVVVVLAAPPVVLATPHSLNQPLQKQRKPKKDKIKWFCATAYEIRLVNAEGEIVDQAADGVVAGKAVRKVEPGYPTQAVIDRIQGTVIIEATVSEAGDIDSIKNVSGPSALMKASIEAAKRWRFTSTTVEGTPIQALARITFKYDLGLR